jgi:hypothetical protein
MQRLWRLLDAPVYGEVPSAPGIWGEIYYRLHKLAKRWHAQVRQVEQQHSRFHPGHAGFAERRGDARRSRIRSNGATPFPSCISASTRSAICVSKLRIWCVSPTSSAI